MLDIEKRKPEGCIALHREKHMGFCHIEGRGRSLWGGFDDLLTTCMECPGTPDGKTIAGPPDLWALCTLSSKLIEMTEKLNAGNERRVSGHTVHH